MTEQHVKPRSTSKAGELARAAWQSVTFLHCTVVVLVVALTVALLVATVSRPVPQALLAQGKSPVVTQCPGMYGFTARLNEIATPLQPVTADSPTVAVTGRFDQTSGHPDVVNVVTTKGTIFFVATKKPGDQVSQLWVVPSLVSRVQIRDHLTLITGDTVFTVCVAAGPL